jgi:hypothetical protein
MPFWSLLTLFAVHVRGSHPPLTVVDVIVVVVGVVVVVVVVVIVGLAGLFLQVLLYFVYIHRSVMTRNLLVNKWDSHSTNVLT